MTLTLVCEDGHMQTFPNLASVPTISLYGYKDIKGEHAGWKCKSCGKPCMKDPSTGKFVATATGAKEND